MRRHIPLLSLACLLLSSCGGSTAAECSQAYWDGEVGTCLPSGWTVLDRANLDDRGVPDEAIVAFQTSDSIAGQYLTVVVTREHLPTDVKPSVYSEAGAASVTSLPGYARVNQRTVNIDGVNHILHVFTAQPSAEQPMGRFYQLSTAKGREGYTFTAATPVSIDDSAEESIMAILENATLVSSSQDSEATPKE